MARPENVKQIYFTVTEEEKAELQDYCKKNGISMNAAMEKARSLLLLDGMKGMVPDLAGAIEGFELCLDRILTYYKQALERSTDARAAAEMEVKGQLEGMQTLSEEFKYVKNELEKRDAEIQSMSDLINSQDSEIRELKRSLAEKKSFEEENKELRSKNEVLTKENFDLQRNFNEEIKKNNDENFEKILQIMAATGNNKDLVPAKNKDRNL